MEEKEGYLSAKNITQRTPKSAKIAVSNGTVTNASGIGYVIDLKGELLYHKELLGDLLVFI